MRKKRKVKSWNHLLWSLICTLTVACFYWLSASYQAVQQPSASRPTELYSNQTRDDLRSAFIQAINEASQSIYLSIYSLTDRSLIAELRKKSEEGVDVTVIYDADASEGVHRKLGKKVHAVSRKGRGLMHQKILVVDDLKCWIGSANFTPTSLRSHGNLVLGFYCPELAKTLKEKAQTLAREGKVKTIASRNFQINGQKVEMRFLPDDADAVARIKQLIRSAKKTIKIAMFTWTRRDFANEVIEANKRGVRTEVVLDRNSGQGVSALALDILQRNGIPVRVSQGTPLLHHKFMIVDDEILVNGSANWTKAAFTQNDDCFIVLHDLTTEQKNRLEQLWEVILEESDSVAEDHL